MQENSRTVNTIRNFSFSMASYTLNMLLSFVTRTIFIQCLAKEYLGVNGLFSNIISLLSLAELGAGGAFVSLLYKPIAQKKTDDICLVMVSFRKAYRTIAVAIGVIGFSLTPFLDSIVGENNIEELPLIYVLYICNSIVGYLCASEKALIKADQKAYIVTKCSQVAVIIQYVLQSLFLVLTHNYIVYLLIQILCAIGGNLYIAHRAGKMYPYLKKKPGKLPVEMKDDIIKKVKGGFCTHFGYVIASGTDSIVISHYLGLTVLGIYSNYLMVLGIIEKFVLMVFEAARASASNFVVSKDKDENYQFFKKMNFFIMVLLGFVCTNLAVLFNPFIKVWIGDEFMMEFPLVFLAVVVFFIGWHGVKLPISLFREATGLYYMDRYFALLEGIANVCISIALVKKMGLYGVLLGTVISSFITTFSGVYLIFRYVFQKPIYLYFVEMVKYILIEVVIGATCITVCRRFPMTNLIQFILCSSVCLIISGGLYFLVFSWTKEFKYFLAVIKNLLSHGKGTGHK